MLTLLFMRMVLGSNSVENTSSSSIPILLLIVVVVEAVVAIVDQRLKHKEISENLASSQIVSFPV